jgi:hypothetical protein
MGHGAWGVGQKIICDNLRDQRENKKELTQGTLRTTVNHIDTINDKR